MIVVIEVPKLSVPISNSYKIQGPKSIFYLYPGSFNRTLKNYNENITEIHTNPSNYHYELIGFDYNFGKNKDYFGYIVSKITIDLNLSSKKIFDVIKNFFNPLLSIFSFLMCEIFTITKVYLFRRKSWGYSFIQMLETPNFHQETSSALMLKRQISRYDVEFIIPCMLARFCGKEHYLEFIEEYIAGKIKSFFMGKELSSYWNCLEHFANKFCTSKAKNKLLKPNKLHAINRIVNASICLMNDDDVSFPDLTINEIKSKGWLLRNNRPPIKNRIFYMLKRKSIKLSEEEKNVIKIIYEIRNKLYHEEYYISRLLERLSRKFHLNDLKLLEITLFTEKFSLIVEKVILGFFKIIPNYYQLVEEEYFHTLHKKEINLPSLQAAEQAERIERDQRLRTVGLTSRESDLRHLFFFKKDLVRNGKYISIIKFLDRFKLKIRQTIQNNFVSGKISNPNVSINCKVKFKDNLNGYIEFLTNDNRLIHEIKGSKSTFVSNVNSTFDNFRITFSPFIKKISYTMPNSVNPSGKFFTLLIEIKKGMND